MTASLGSAVAASVTAAVAPSFGASLGVDMGGAGGDGVAAAAGDVPGGRAANTPRTGAHPLTFPTMAATNAHRTKARCLCLTSKIAVRKKFSMTLLLLEALGALLIFVFIIWWTMFSGRKNGEPIDPPADERKESQNKPK